MPDKAQFMQQKKYPLRGNLIVQNIPGKGSARQWLDWRWQLDNRITDVCLAADLLNMPAGQRTALNLVAENYPFCVTPYYLALCNPRDGHDPITRQIMPDRRELAAKHAPRDPLGEETYSPVPGLIHRYRNRAVVITTTDCAARCRHCTRKNTLSSFDANSVSGSLKEVGPDCQSGRQNGRSTAEPCLWRGKQGCLPRSKRGSALPGNNSQIPDSIFRRLPAIKKYIRQNPQIREVLVSGGDPLLLETSLLDRIMGELTAIKSIEVLRIGTRAPVVLPMRVDKELCECLKKHRPLWVNTQFNHPREITPEAIAACRLMQEAGVPVSNQAVLLRGVNDSFSVLTALCNGLQRIMVRPYYVFQCDGVRGTTHFSVPPGKAAKLSRRLRSSLGGLSMPLFVADLPGRNSKVPI